MAVVDVGKTHSESLSVSVFQTGSSRLESNLNYSLFGDNVQSDEYVVGVESCSVPLDATTYLSDQPENALLVSLKRRRNGVAWSEERTALHGWTDGALASDMAIVNAPVAVRAYNTTVGDLRSDVYTVRDFGDLVVVLNNWAIGIDQTIRQYGLPNVNTVAGDLMFSQTWDWNEQHQQQDVFTEEEKKSTHFEVRITPSGSIVFTGSTLFWRAFFLEFSPYAREVFGFQKYVGFDDTGALRTDFSGDLVHSGILLTNEALWKVQLAIQGERSIWSSLETRLAVSLGTSIPMQRSLVITGDKETRTFELGCWPLNNAVEVSCKVQGTSLTSEFSITGESRAGHVVLKRPDTPIVEWLHLKPDTDLRNLRLSLHVRERVFRDGKWSIELRELPVRSWATWSCKLIFVRKT